MNHLTALILKAGNYFGGLTIKAKIVTAVITVASVSVPTFTLLNILPHPNLPFVTSGSFASSGSSGSSGSSQVLGTSTSSIKGSLNIKIPSTFYDNATVKKDLVVEGKATFSDSIIVKDKNLDLGSGQLTASNVLYSLTSGDGLSITSGQSPTIKNTGVLSLGTKTGALVLEAGTDITIDGLKITNKSDLSTVRGRGGCSSCITDADVVSGLTISGGTVNNSTIGATTASTGAFTTLTASSTLGVTGATTLSSTLSVTGASTLTGAVTASSTLAVSGATTLNGNVTLGDASSDTITFTGRAASDLIPSGSYSLGSEALPWSKLYLTGISSFGGQTTFTSTPTGTGVNNGSIYINPSSANSTYTLFGIAVGGEERLRMDATGNITVQGNLVGPTGGSIGYWSRAGTRVYPYTINDTIGTFGNVGVGTTGTSYNLDVLGTGRFTSNNAAIYLTGTNPSIVSTGSNPLSLFSGSGNIGIGTSTTYGVLQAGGTNLAPGLIVTSAGNVGIGLTNPTAYLQVNGNALFTNALTSGTAGTGLQINTGDPNTKGLIIKGNTYTPASTQPNTISGLQLWLKADAITGLTDGQAVTTWNDSSGNGYDATQATASKKPLYKTNILNGQPVVRFDGSNDVLITSSTSIAFKTIIAVINYRGSSPFTNYDAVVARNTFSDDVSLMANDGNATLLRAANGTIYVNGTQTNEFAPLSSYKVVSKVITTGATGAAEVAHEDGGGGGDRYWNGDIAEIIIYNSALSSTDRTNIEAYLANKYGITYTTTTPQASNLQEWQNSSGTVLGAVGPTGNLGIGISAPSYPLDISGAMRLTSTAQFGAGGLFGFGAGSIAIPSNGLAVSGNVGVGTTSPLGALHVVGQCVTGDTLLKRRRRRRRGKDDEEIDLINLINLISKQNLSTNDPKVKKLAAKLGIRNFDIGYLLDQLDQLEIRNSEYDYDDVRIDEINPGDEILSLNENTQEFEYQRVEKLLDMGTKGVYELTTKSGKKIKTTDNHPYLVKQVLNRSQKHYSPIQGAGWIGVTNLKVGDQIAVAGLRSSDRKLRLLEESNISKHQSYNSQEESNQSPGISVKNISLFTIHRELLSENAINRETITPNKFPVKTNALFAPFVSEKLGTIMTAPNQPAAKFTNTSATIDLNTGFIESTAATLSENSQAVNKFSWDEIIDIKYIGYEHVYDLQISNTHNFVGNNIVAHNTYINGSLGLGTAFTGVTTPANGLAVQGNLGVGTTTASHNLEVVGTGAFSSALSLASGTATTPGLNFSGDTDTGLWSIGTNILGLTTNGSGSLQSGTTINGLSVNANGNVGIGITNPAQKLDVVGSIALPTTIDSTSGVIYKGANRFIHNFNLAGTDGYNTFVGINAGNFTMTGSTGTLGSYNTAIGQNALTTNTTGYYNTADGMGTLQINTTGNSNTASGALSLYSNTTGNYNTANGVQSLQANTTGSNNTASGVNTLLSNSTGNSNTANGMGALHSNTTGSNNTASGVNTLYSNISGASNTAYGVAALYYNTTGAQNTAFGASSSYNPDNDIAQFRIVADTNMTFLGYGATKDNASTLTNGTAIGNGAHVLASNQVVLGNDSVTTTLLKGNVGIGVTAPTAYLNIKAGTATANTAPLKLTSGTLNTTAEAGAIEFLTDAYYGTITTGAARKTFAFLESPVFTTQITTPLVLGGTGTTQDLTLQTTSGIGATGADMHFLVGNNGATEAMTILDNGNVGIGITASNAQLTLTGGGVFGFGTATAPSLASGAILGVNGNVGVGTTSPLGALHVVGQCVTWDTKIRIRRRKKGKYAQEDDEIEHDYFEVMIKDVLAGDEVLSLNETTQEFEYQKVEKLLDMGSKGVYEVTTRSGKTIKTTSEHPYLVKEVLGRPLKHYSPILGVGWIGVTNLKVGDQIAVLGSVFGRSSSRSNLNQGESNNKKSEKHQSQNVHIPESKVHDSFLLNLYAQYRDTIPATTSNVNTMTFNEASIPGNAGPKVATPNQNIDMLMAKSATTEINTTFPLFIKDHSITTFSTFQWDEIVGIKYIGYEHVFDLQISNTHNFLANNIIAHNTYINGSLGLGTAFTGATTPANGLAVSGNVGIGTTTANYNLTDIGTLGVTGGNNALGTGLYVNSLGNVGIGTSVPSLSRFQLQGSGTSTGINFLTTGSDLTQGLTVLDNGNVGVGTTGPGTALHINRTSTSTLPFLLMTGKGTFPSSPTDVVNGAAFSLIYNDTNNRQFWIGDSLSGAGIRYIDATISGWNNASSADLDVSIGANGKNVYFPSSGSVGIGTASPGSKLSVIGNVGIGTSASGAALQVNGGGLFGWGTASSSLSSGAILGVNGNVGVGTTSPLGALHVVGQCVTGDTLLKRRRRRRRGKDDEEIDLINLINLISKQNLSTNDPKVKKLAAKLGIRNFDIGYLLDQLDQLEIRNSEYDYDDVRIDQIQPGDEVLTLDEKSGEFVYQQVNNLMDMGKKDIIKITTVSGKSIRTTSEHPYLTIQDNKREDRFFAKRPLYLFIDETGMGNDPNQPYFGVGGLAVKDTISLNIKLHNIFEKLLSSLCGDGTHLEFKFSNITRDNKNFYNQVLDVLFASSDWEFNSLLIKKGGKGWTPYSYWKRYLGNVIELANLFPKQQLNIVADYLSKPNVSVKSLKSILYKKNIENVLQLESQGSLLLQVADILLGAIAFKLREKKDQQAKIKEAKQEIADRVWNKLIANKKDGYKVTLYRLNAAMALSPDCKVSITKRLLLVKKQWVKVKDLSVGAEIATTSGWEQIKKIEHLPREQVYDIEVEGTHNFVGGHYVDIRTGKALSQKDEEVIYQLFTVVGHTGDSLINENQGKSNSQQPGSNISSIDPLVNLLQSHSDLLSNIIAKYKKSIVPNSLTVKSKMEAEGVNTVTKDAAETLTENPEYTLNAEEERVISLINKKLAEKNYTVKLEDLPYIQFGGIVAHNTYINGSLGLGTAFTGVTTPANGLAVQGNVGIGTTTASHNLEIVGTGAFSSALSLASGTATTPGLNFSGDTDTGLWSVGTNILGLTTNGSGSLATGTTINGLSVNANGNVGIGTTGPTVALDVVGAGKFSSDVTINGLTVGKGTNSLSTNTAFGVSALAGNNSGTAQNIAIGYQAMLSNTTGLKNTAVGYQALYTETTNSDNTAFGNQALYNTNGANNTAVGSGALYNVTSGSANTALGYFALYNATGGNNVAIGHQAGRYETGSNAFYVDNQDRVNTAGDKAGALLYGTFSATPSLQTLKVNAALTVSQNVGIGNTNPGSGLQLGSNAVIGFGNATAIAGPTNGLAVSGNVGIGTTTANSNLTVIGGATIGSDYGQYTAPVNGLLIQGNLGIGTSVSSNPLTVGTDGTNGNGAYLTAGGTWTNGSSFEFKENFVSLNSLDILSKINSLNLTQWNYKLEPDVKHIGPIAEEFYSTFGLGNDNKHISTIDPAGVALVGVQGLSLDISNIKDQISKLQLDMSKLNYGMASDSAKLATDSASLSPSSSPSPIKGEGIITPSTLVGEGQGEGRLTDPSILLATSSAQLTSNLTMKQFNNLSLSEATISGMLKTYDLNVSESLKVFGSTFLGNTNIAGDLSIDGTLSISNGSEINVVGASCHPVLDTGSINNDRLLDSRLRGNDNCGILYLQNSPLAQGLDIFNGKVTIDKNGSLTAQTITASEYQAVSGKSTGGGIIKAGDKTVEISSPIVKPNSRIFITPTSPTGKQSLIVIQNPTRQSFTVIIEEQYKDDITFNWWVINEVTK